MEEYKNINDIINNINNGKYDELEQDVNIYYNNTNYNF